MLPGTNTLRVDDAVTLGAGVIGLLENDPPIPLGPDIARATGDAKLSSEVTMMLSVPDEPWESTRVDVPSPIEKSPAYSMKAQEFA